jgi:uroporphyrinogen-III synthase
MKKKILITAPEGYARRFRDALLTVSGPTGPSFSPVSAPLIKTELDTAAEAHKSLPSIGDDDIVVFTSRKAIEATALWCQRQGLVLPPAATYVAIGKDASWMSALLSLPQGLSGCEPSLMGIVKALGERPDADKKRVWVLGPRVVGMREPPTVPDFLTALGNRVGEVCYVPAYTTRPADSATRHTAYTLIQQGIDCVALTSGGEAQVLRKVVETSPEGMALISSTPIACFGPYTAKCAKSEGLPVDIISDRYHSFTEFAAYLKDHLSWV